MSVLSNIYDQMSSAASYRPGNTTIFDDMTLEAGDVITVTSGDKNHTTALNTVDLIWNGSAMMTVGAQGQQKRDSLTKLSRKKYAGTVGGSGGGWGYRNSKKAYTEIIQNDEMIQLVASKTGIDGLAEDETLYSKLTVTAEAISSEVTRAQGAEATLSSSITQTAEQIRTEVSNTESRLSSSITQQADRISLVVEGTGSGATVKRAAIIAAINEDGSSTASIEADNIKISGNINLNNVIKTTSIGGQTMSLVDAGSVSGNFGSFGTTNIDTLYYKGSSSAGTAYTLMGLQSFTIDNVEQAKFIGTAPVNFDRTAARREGANSVYISPSDIILDTSEYYLNSGNPYYEVDVEATPSSTLFPTWSGESTTGTITVDASKAYKDGQDSVVQRSVNGITAYGSPSYANNTCTQPCTVTFSDGNTQRNANTTVDTTDSYNLGKNSVSQRTVNGITAYGDPTYADSTCTQPCTVTFSDGNTQRNTKTTLNTTASYTLGTDSVDFTDFTFSGDTLATTTREMYANIDNGKRKGITINLYSTYEEDSGTTSGWHGSAPAYKKYVFFRTGNGSSYSSKLRCEIDASWVYAQGKAAGGGGSPTINIERGTRTATGPSPSNAVQIWSGNPTAVTVNNSFYSFKVTAGSSEKHYYFYVKV